MKSIVIAAVFLSLALQCHAQKTNKVKGDKEVVSVSREIKESFTAIEVSNNIVVKLQNGTKTSYILTADQNLIDQVEIQVQKETLKIFTRSTITNSKKLEIHLSIQDFNSLVVNNNAIVKSIKTLELDKINISLNNSSKIELSLIVKKDAEINIADNAGGKMSLSSTNAVIKMNNRSDLKAKMNCKILDVNLENSAEIHLDGEATTSIYNVKGTSNLDARKMKSKTAVLKSKNKSDIFINASKSLEINAEGKSEIYVYGNPEIKIIGFMDKSRIIKK